MPAFYPVVLAGGAGTRFWPASRRAEPKHLVPLVGKQTLFDATLSRLRKLAPPKNTCVVTSAALEGVTRRALEGHPGVRLLLEPEARNTAVAIAWAAACVAGNDPDAVVGIFPADHHIPKAGDFARAATIAVRGAADGENLVLIGIEPTRPDTAYGYLRIAGRGTRTAAKVHRFAEKPSAASARRYLRAGDYLWNAGMVVARPGRILAETEAHGPEVWHAMGGVLSDIARGKSVSRARLARAYRRVVNKSFDFAVLERSQRVIAVRGRFAWSDLGSWDSLGEHLPDIGDNRVKGGRPVFLGARDNIVWNATGKQIVILGVNDLIVVETDDALLVCQTDRAQDVRDAVEELKRRKRTDLT